MRSRAKCNQVKSGSPVTVKFENDKNATLRIEKTDIVTGKPMENVEFSIVRDDGKTYGKYYTEQTRRNQSGIYVPGWHLPDP